MTLDPDDIREGKCVFERFEKFWNGRKMSRLESIDESVPDRSLSISFFDTLVSYCETGSEEDLMKVWLFSGEFGDRFFREDVDFSG